VPVAGHRVLSPDQKALLTAHRQQVTRARRATASALNPGIPASAGHAGQRPSAQAITAQTLTDYKVSTPAAARPQTIGALHPTARPQTIGDLHQQLAGGDPVLAQLGAPGASAKALQAYVDARVATDVAQQAGQISAQQSQATKDALFKMHAEQQKLIAITRRQYIAGNTKSDTDLEKHTVMNSLFALAGVGLAVAGIATGLAPVMAALIAGIVPLVNVIHDYARNLG
jgi:hypothetical protein